MYVQRNQKVNYHFTAWLISSADCVFEESDPVFLCEFLFLLPWFLLPFCKHYLQSLKIHDETWFYKPYDYTMYIQVISQLLCNITQGSFEKSLACFIITTVHKLQEPDHLHLPSVAVINYHYLYIQKAWLVTHSKQHEFVHFYTLCCSCWWDVVGSVKNYRLD